MRASHLLLCMFIATTAIACASTDRVALDTATLDDRPAVLLLATDAYEIHYRDGRVLLLDQRPGAPATPQEVRTYEEFKALYEVRKETSLPEEQPPRGVAVNGYRGLECVRAGVACGRSPEDPSPGTLVRLQLRFPQSAQ